MKNIKLLIVTSLFSSFLLGCGMKGPLYQSPQAQATAANAEQAMVAAQPSVNNNGAEMQTEQPTQPIDNSVATISEINAQPPETTPENPPATVSLFTPSAQLLAVPASHFTVQLAAMHSQKSLNEFVTTHNLPQNNVYIYQTIHNNQPRYVVIFGNYDSKQMATTASRSLPGSLANIDTWIKNYQLVHQDLLLNNR